jgi:hypothetical protein
VLACAMSFFGLLGMMGLYARQAVKSGWLGLVGFVMFSLWLVLIMGFSFVEAFILPHLATVTPLFVEGWMGMFNGTASKVNLGVLPTLWMITGPLYILGGLLFCCLASRRSAPEFCPVGPPYCLQSEPHWPPWPACSPLSLSRK